MEQTTTVANVSKIKNLLQAENVKKRFNEMLGKKSAGFISSILSAVNNSALLAKCEPNSVIASAAIAASMDLPINPNLGFAALVPYKNKEGEYICSTQLMYRSFIQLAIRTGQYKTINATPIYEGEIIRENRLTGEIEFDFDYRTSDKIIGYASYFKLINGFEKTFFMSIKELEQHAFRFSKSYKKGEGLWADKEFGFDSMCIKTVLKLLLSKYGILSIDMQTALTHDQAVVTEIDSEPIYLDNNEELPKSLDEKSKELTQNASNEIQKKHDLINGDKKEPVQEKKRGRPPKKNSEDKEEAEDYDIPPLGENGRREFESQLDLYDHLKKLGITEDGFKSIKSELVNKFLNMEDLCSTGTVEEVNEVIKAYKK